LIANTGHLPVWFVFLAAWLIVPALTVIPFRFSAADA